MRRHLLLLLSLLACQFGFAQNYNIIEPELQDVLEQKGNDMISVNIILDSEIDINDLRNNVRGISDAKTHRQTIVNEFKNFSEQSQKDILSILKKGLTEGEIKDITPLKEICDFAHSKGLSVMVHSSNCPVKMENFLKFSFLIGTQKM